jgi:hypothetical protein
MTLNKKIHQLQIYCSNQGLQLWFLVVTPAMVILTNLNFRLCELEPYFWDLK